MVSKSLMAAAALCAMLLAAPAQADDNTVTVGMILPMTGPQASTGKQERAGAELYVKEHGDTVAGKKIALLIKDDTGAADVTKRLAEELIGNDHANVLMGFGLTPLALAAAPVATEAKVPEIVSAAATAMITEKSPYVVRTSFTLPQAAAPMAEWALKNGIKKVVTIVTDYGPGVDAEKWFSDTFEKGGGKVRQKIRVPLKNPDFAPFLQRVKDDAPDAVFVFVPSGQGAVFMKEFVERGLDKSGIKLIGTGDVTDDDLLAEIGDSALGAVTTHHYSADHDCREQGLRRRLRKGQQRHAAEFHGRRRLRRHGARLQGARKNQGRRERRRADRRDEGHELDEPARVGLDRPADARHRAEHLCPQGREEGRRALQRRIRHDPEREGPLQGRQALDRIVILVGSATAPLRPAPCGGGPGWGVARTYQRG